MKKPQQTAVTGITRLKRKVLTLIMILIFLPQLVSSQEVNTNPVSKTVTLSNEKTIDVAKIIKNEQRLRLVNQELIETIRKQDSTIQALTRINIAGLETIENQNGQIYQLSSDVLRFSNMQLEYSDKKKKVSKLFISLKYDYAPALQTNLPGIGLDFFTGRLGFGVSAGAVNKEYYYGGRLSFAIW